MNEKEKLLHEIGAYYNYSFNEEFLEGFKALLKENSKKDLSADAELVLTQALVEIEYRMREFVSFKKNVDNFLHFFSEMGKTYSGMFMQKFKKMIQRARGGDIKERIWELYSIRKFKKLVGFFSSQELRKTYETEKLKRSLFDLLFPIVIKKVVDSFDFKLSKKKNCHLLKDARKDSELLYNVKREVYYRLQIMRGLPYVFYGTLFVFAAGQYNGIMLKSATGESSFMVTFGAGIVCLIFFLFCLKMSRNDNFKIPKISKLKFKA